MNEKILIHAHAENIFSLATVNRTSAVMITDSVGPAGPATRLASIYAVFPKMVMVERNRHRGMSLSDRSSRAVPPEKLIEEIRSGQGLAMPAKFKRRVKGMGGGEELQGSELHEAQVDWIEDALCAADAAERAGERGEAKETVNRRLDPYIYAHTLMTATRDIWLNFLGLRLVNADPTIEVLARECYRVLKASTPKLLQPGEWHLPFVDDDDWSLYPQDIIEGGDGYLLHDEALEVVRRVSTARCAHLSFQDLETGLRMEHKKALQIYDKLITSRPIHPSPAEHQATPDEWRPYTGTDHGEWVHPSQHGNFYGWIQHRKTLPGEAVAALPEGYEL